MFSVLQTDASPLMTREPMYHSVYVDIPEVPSRHQSKGHYWAYLIAAVGLCGALLLTVPHPINSHPSVLVIPQPQVRPVTAQPQTSAVSTRKAIRAGIVASILAMAGATGDSLAAGNFFNSQPLPVDRMQAADMAEVTKYLTPGSAKDAPPVFAGSNYNPEFDAEYAPQDSFENILGLVVKLLVFAPIVAFLAFFLYGFLSNSEEGTQRQAAVAEPQDKPRKPLKAAIPLVEEEVVPQAIAEPTPVLDRAVVSLEDVAAADPAKEHVALYFRPIPDGVGFAELRRLFRTFGEVECLTLKEDHGFVWMNEKSATTAIAVLHGGEFRNTRMIVRMADTNKLPPAQKQFILRQSQIQSQKMEKVENRSIHYFRCLASTAAKAAKSVGINDKGAEEKSPWQKALENMCSTLEDIANHHVVDTVESRSTAQVGLDELVKLATALREAQTENEQKQAAVRILDCVTKYADMEVIPHHTKKDGETMALYFRPVPKGVDASVYTELFNRYGDVEAIQLKEKYGFVWMEEAGARAALELLQGYRVPGGRLFVSVAKQNALVKSDKSKALRVGPRNKTGDDAKKATVATVAEKPETQ